MDCGTENAPGRRRIPRRRTLVVLAVLAGGFAAAPVAAEDAAGNDTIRLETTTVTGNRELPRIMVIVPWKQALPGNLPGRPAESLLDEALAPIDRQVFRRQLAFYESLEGAPDAEPVKAGDTQQRIVEESGG